MTNKAYELARTFEGLWEWKGKDHNPEIVKWFAEVGHDWVKNDETAWCAAFCGAMLERTGINSTRKLNAKSYKDWGYAVPINDAHVGDILVFDRPPKAWHGHVGFFVRWDGPDHIIVFGGNQTNQVRESRYRRDKLEAVRRAPEWDVVQAPAPVDPEPGLQVDLERLRAELHADIDKSIDAALAGKMGAAA